MSEVDNFVSAVKEKRNEAVEYFLSEDFMQAQAAADTPDTAIKVGLDKLVGAILDVVEERYADLIEATATTDDGEPALVEMTITPELSTLYFEEVAS